MQTSNWFGKVQAWSMLSFFFQTPPSPSLSELLGYTWSRFPPVGRLPEEGLRASGEGGEEARRSNHTNEQVSSTGLWGFKMKYFEAGSGRLSVLFKNNSVSAFFLLAAEVYTITLFPFNSYMQIWLGYVFWSVNAYFLYQVYFYSLSQTASNGASFVYFIVYLVPFCLCIPVCLTLCTCWYSLLYYRKYLVL